MTITGRLKDIIIRNAENISASEVEEVLQRHPSIADVAVIGLPDPRTGERACAVVTLVDGVTSLTLVEVAEHCRELGPREAEGARAARDRRRDPPQRHGQDPEARPQEALRRR